MSNVVFDSVVTLEWVTPNAVQKIEDAGRTCYDSVAKDPGFLVKHVIKNGHESVLEHASASFRIDCVSRAFSHQLVRHRLASYSQRSQRYVNEGQFGFVVPPSVILMGGVMLDDYINDMAIIQKMYEKWRDRGLKKEDARFFLPNACCTEIVMTCNCREWRSVLELRCDSHAQWEIRSVCMKILDTLHTEIPFVFDDLYTKFVVV